MIEQFEHASKKLRYDPSPHMFHQANLRFFTFNDYAFAQAKNKNIYNNGLPAVANSSFLMTMWIDQVVGKMMEFNTLPILTYKMDDLYTYYLQREKCDIDVKIVFDNTSTTTTTNTANTTTATATPKTFL